jgi:hypothetical protein
MDTAQPEFQVFFRVMSHTGLRAPAISALSMHSRRQALLEAQVILAFHAQPRWGEYFSRCDAALDALRKG